MFQFFLFFNFISFFWIFVTLWFWSLCVSFCYFSLILLYFLLLSPFLKIHFIFVSFHVLCHLFTPFCLILVVWNSFLVTSVEHLYFENLPGVLGTAGQNAEVWVILERKTASSWVWTLQLETLSSSSAAESWTVSFWTFAFLSTSNFILTSCFSGYVTQISGHHQKSIRSPLRVRFTGSATYARLLSELGQFYFPGSFLEKSAELKSSQNLQIFSDRAALHFGSSLFVFIVYLIAGRVGLKSWFITE